MRLEKCWFCSSTIYPGHGIQFVRNDAKIFRFCRSKCHKNFKMKRNPRKVKWTKAYRRLHGKDMTQDSTFEFERKRNRPERYDRNVTENTLKAMKKIYKVRAVREFSHIVKRRVGKKAKELEQAKKELQQDISLVIAPSSHSGGNLRRLPSGECFLVSPLKRSGFEIVILHAFLPAVGNSSYESNTVKRVSPFFWVPPSREALALKRVLNTIYFLLFNT
ncbi:Ribosome biogenesis protein RLP [Parasponia andersonii]|uniref:Ribosome biogenesis protein RLP n=1 Tax=Parasponia andersonii TaxID=3476 RepID=A0A2P5AIH9_PARAD|nr:Ribosome biogenesis protein RLP [Parasponia andersonii]